MKKISILFCTGVLMSALCAAFVACNKSQGTELQEVDVPFTEYSLTGESGEEFSARWVNLDCDEKDGYGGKTLIINSDKELKKYVEGEYPPIDFSKKTLVLAYGREGNGVVPNRQNFQQVSERNYAMMVNLLPYLTSVITEWQSAIVVDKLPSNSKIELNITIKWKE